MRYVATVFMSFLISNWLYAEFLLLFPQAKPFCKRFIEVVKLPTHDEWHPMLTSREGKKLRYEIREYLSTSAAANVFTQLGVLDSDIQMRVLRTGVFGDKCDQYDCGALSEGNLFESSEYRSNGMAVF